MEWRLQATEGVETGAWPLGLIDDGRSADEGGVG